MVQRLEPALRHLQGVRHTFADSRHTQRSRLELANPNKRPGTELHSMPGQFRLRAANNQGRRLRQSCLSAAFNLVNVPWPRNYGTTSLVALVIARADARAGAQ